MIKKILHFSASVPLFFLMASLALGAAIDAQYKYAWGENIGWINFGTPEGGVDVGTITLTGYAWGENVGWISLNCSNTDSCPGGGTLPNVDYKVTRSGSTLTGYAWGENVGWISFSCSNTGTCGSVSYGVVIDAATDFFSGYAWGENVGWVSFNCSNTGSCVAVDYKVGLVAGGGGPSPTPTIVDTPTPTSTIGVTPSVTPTVSPTPVPSSTIVPVPTVTPPGGGGGPSTPPPSVSPTVPPSGGIGGGVAGGITVAAQALDQLFENFFEALANPEAVANAAATVTTLALIPIVAATVGAFAQKEVVASVFQLLYVFGIRKRPKVWGVVYDSSTKRPIPLAKVELIDSAGRILETRYGDRDGRYGFLTSPSSLHAPELRVRIRAQKPGYAFPTGHGTEGTDFVVYNNSYRGDELVLHGDALVTYDIPIDPLVRGRSSFGGSGSGWHLLGTIGNRLLSLGFFIGLIVVPLNLWFLPNTTNIIIFIVFFVVNGIQIFILHRPYGITSDALTGKRLPFALVTLNDLQGNRVGFAVSDEQGRFILSGEQNKDYELLAYTPAHIVPQRSVRMGIRGLRRLSARAWITTNLRI